MELIVTGKNIPVSDKLEAYVRRKIGRLDRHLSEPVETRVELSKENTKNIEQRQIVQVTMFKNGTIIRAEERAADMHSAIDLVVDKLDKQIRRYKDKQVRKRRIGGSVAGEALQEETIQTEPRIVRFKRVRTEPMSEDAAVEQMELLGHSFFLFRNERTDNLNVVYKRQDGNYGLLEPEGM